MDALRGALEAIVGPGHVLDKDALAGRQVGHCPENLDAKALVRPADTDEIAAVLALCHGRGQTVVTHGGLTGLVNGGASRPDDIVLSLERMNRIEEIDPVGRTMTVQAGALLQTVQEAAEAAGLMFPLDLGARGSCTIGGNIATNAGGCRVIRYGMTRDLVLGLEAVLADGTVVSSLNRMIKNNSGYDLKQLFIGAEGTLGVVSRAVLRLRERPAAENTALAAAGSLDAVAALLRATERSLGGGLASFEVMWREFYAKMSALAAPGAAPLAADHPYYVLIEELTNEDGAGRLQETLEGALGDGLVVDAVVAKSSAERAAIWRIRDETGLLYDCYRAANSFDVSLPIGEMEGYVAAVRAGIAEAFPESAVYVFGHLGDGNLHLLVGGESLDADDFHAIEEIVYRPLVSVRGSISAEHGIGLKKKAYLGLSRSTAEIALMRTLKQALDPRGILNPGKIFD